MTQRASRATCSVIFALAVLGGCQADTIDFSTAALSPAECGDAGVASNPGPIGSPCIPDQENLATFGGFSRDEISLQSCSGQRSGAPVCLALHFQGRASCPYGQNANGQAPPGASPCKTPGGEPVVGTLSPAVLPQCADRRASRVVFWTCRCANADGQTNDSESYCTCPAGTQCEPVIASLGSEKSLAGSYCVPSDANLDPSTSCSTVCDPTVHSCN
jgi:hypothetical protein